MTFTAAGMLNLFKDLNAFGSVVVPAQLVRRQKQVAILLLTGFTLKTPVKTGRARGGWIVSVGTFSDSERNRQDKIGRSTISDGVSTIKTAKPFSNILINNNVNYIMFLNDGTLRTAAHKMIELTIEEVKAHKFTDSDPSGS